MSHLKYLAFFAILLIQKTECLVVCTAADRIYFPHLLNFIGSLHKTNFNELEMLMVYDLGLTVEQISTLQKIEKLEICQVRKVHPDILKGFIIHPNGRSVPGWYAWKPVVIKQALEKNQTVLWIDAGTTILNRLNLFIAI